MSAQGKILKGIGGFYYIHVPENGIYECKAKGVFRNKNIKPAVGDDVLIDVIDNEKFLGNIVDILPRNNKLVRPSVANVDQAVIIFALTQPEPNYNLLDRFLIMMERQEVKVIICLNKSDLVGKDEANDICKIYSECGYEVVVCNATNQGEDEGVIRMRELLKGKTTVFAGPSGVGKSSMLNAIASDIADIEVKTGEISEKVKRGKHTTRHSELITVGEDTYIMDTPGFTSLYVEEMEPEDLKFYYEEFLNLHEECRFSGCVHINEPDCAVKEALNQGKISRLRYDNYLQMYEELKNKRRW